MINCKVHCADVHFRHDATVFLQVEMSRSSIVPSFGGTMLLCYFMFDRVLHRIILEKNRKAFRPD